MVLFNEDNNFTISKIKYFELKTRSHQHIVFVNILQYYTNKLLSKLPSNDSGTMVNVNPNVNIKNFNWVLKDIKLEYLNTFF